MLLAQVMIPLSAAAAVMFALWFILDTLRRDQGSERARATGAAVRNSLGTLSRRQIGAAGAFSLVAAAAAGAVAWYYEDSVEIGCIAAAAVLLGAISSALAAYAGVGLAGAAVSRVAVAAPGSASSAVGAALGVAVVPGLLATGLNLGSLAGAFAITTRFLGYSPSQAPYLLVAFALGASIVAPVMRVSGGIFANAASLAAGLTTPPTAASDPAAATTMAGHQATSGSGIADLSESSVLVTVATMLLGSSLATVTGDIDWLLLPLVLGAVSVFAVLAGALSAQVLALRAPEPGPLFARATAVTLAVGASGIAAVTSALLGEAWYWFFLSGLAGITAAPALMLLNRYSRIGPSSASARVARASRSGPASNIITGLAAGFEATAITAVTVAAVVVAAFALGYQADVQYVSGTAAGLFGIAVAATGLLLPGPFVATMPAFAGIATAAASGVEPGENAEALAKLAASAQPVAQLSRVYSLAAAGMAVVLALLAFGEVIRANLASVAVDDPERYATLAQDLDLLQPGEDVKFAAANAVASAVASLEELRESVADDSRFGAWHVMRLAVANRSESEGLVAALVDRDDLTPRQGSSIQPSPLALPRPLPMSFSRPEVLAAAFIGLTLVLLAAAAVVRSAGRSAGRLIDEFDRRRTDAGGDPGTREPVAAAAAPAAVRGVFPVVAYAVVVPLVAGIAARYGFGGDGNHGWLAVAGLMLSASIGGVLLASFLEAAGAAWSGAATALASVPVPDDGVSPVPPPDPSVLAASAVGDTVGATLSDAAAPALVVVAKLMAAVALTFAPLFIA
jgi:K(+)-stimulated pyrophosphate-energized sodium pump